ncbi:MAG: CpsB/CapC family capsule biosynthesis tyrosine phosphatase, partial [Clostridia bacterium]
TSTCRSTFIRKELVTMIDVHSHIAWNIDDGITNEQDTLDTIIRAKKDGISTIIATPHINLSEVNTKDKLNEINNRIKELQTLGNQEGINIIKGSEILINHDYQELFNNNLFNTLGETNYILIEFDLSKDIKDIEEVEDWLYEIKILNYKIVIAHVERYFKETLDIERIKKWISNGYYIQVNRTSLLGLDTKKNKANAKKLIKQGLVHLIATDTHSYNGRRTCILSDVKQYLLKNFNIEYSNTILESNPNKLLNNQELELAKPIKKNILKRIIGG